MTGALPNAWQCVRMVSGLFGDFPTGSVIDPLGPETGVERVLRGGSWMHLGRHCRSAYRSHRNYNPSRRIDAYGFRLARGL